jgi:hypothetical protein
VVSLWHIDHLGKRKPTAQSDTAVLCFVADTMIKAAATLNAAVMAKAFAHAYALNVDVFSCPIRLDARRRVQWHEGVC